MHRRFDQWAGLTLALTASWVIVAVGADAQRAPQQVIRGVVVDTGGQPVALAQLLVERGEIAAVSDSTGTFELRLRDKVPRAIDVRRIGYLPVRVALETLPDTALRIAMIPMDATMDRVRTQAELTVRSLEVKGFYRRLRDRTIGANTGYFLTPEDVAQRNTSRATILVDGLPAVRITMYRPCDRCSAYPALFGNSRCPMTVFLDGTRLNTLRRSEPPDIDNFINGRDVGAVEVYTRSNAPNQYGALNGTCGVVLFWTK